MVSFSDLQLEIVSLILEFVDDTSPKSFKAIACVNKYLNEVTRLISHRHKVIQINHSFEYTMKACEKWAEDDAILANIRSITLQGELDNWNYVDSDLDDDHEENDGEDDEDEDEDDDEDDENDDFFEPRQIDLAAWSAHWDSRWQSLGHLISKIGKLRQFNWNVKHPLPIIILDTLEKYQKTSKLSIFNFRRRDPSARQPEPLESRLARSTQLTHIRCACRENISLHDLHNIAFRSIVASAPNLQYAGLVTEYHYPLSDETLLALAEITPNFYQHTKPNSSVRQLTLEGCEISKATLDDWASTVDISLLESVKFSRGLPTLDFFQYAAAALPGLKSLSLNFRLVQNTDHGPEKDELVAAIQDYLSTCSPLNTLSLWSWTGVVTLSAILQRHGPNLRSLALHERESPNHRQILSIEDVKLVRTSCPNLQNFTFDLTRTSKILRWKNDANISYYNELTKINNLSILQIYFDSGAFSHDPYLNNNFANPLTLIPQNEDEESNDEDATAQQSNAQPTSGQTDSPPAKRQKLSKPPTHESHMIPYVQQIWTTVYGHRAGPRHLDVKFGEWEAARSLASRCTRFLKVRPHERDDVAEPVVKVLSRW